MDLWNEIISHTGFHLHNLNRKQRCTKCAQTEAGAKLCKQKWTTLQCTTKSTVCRQTTGSQENISNHKIHFDCKSNTHIYHTFFSGETKQITASTVFISLNICESLWYCFRAQSFNESPTNNERETRLQTKKKHSIIHVHHTLSHSGTTWHQFSPLNKTFGYKH